MPKKTKSVRSKNYYSVYFPEPGDRKKIERAAKKAGKSLSEFLVKSALKAA